MTLVLVIVVWAALLGWSPGLTVIAVALTVLVFDDLDAGIFDRLLTSR